ncbi:MAG: hypothetical protein ACRDWS_12515 [Acidimicrobiia bacterium]
MRLGSVSRIALLSISMALAAVVRNHVDLGAVACSPRLVLDRTIQPVTTKIWLRSQP